MMVSLEEEISDRWTQFRGELENLCDELGREIPKVIAVSKTKSMDHVQAAIDLGIEDFAENYAQEFEKKAKEFPDVNWHFIGHLQRSNAKYVTPYASIIHTLDRKKLTDRLLHFDYDRRCFIQAKISGEDSKYGIDYDMDIIRDLLDYSRDQGLTVDGLMGMGNPDWSDDRTEEEFRKYVDFGRQLGLDNFSLGMTADWQLAVRAGSTHLRIGSAIFGKRSH